MSMHITWFLWYRCLGWKNVSQNKKFYPTIKATHPASWNRMDRSSLTSYTQRTYRYAMPCESMIGQEVTVRGSLLNGTR
jgi:hypothetical protein